MFYAFKTGEKLNPVTGEGDYYEPGGDQVLYIVSAVGKAAKSVVSSWGDVLSGPAVGTQTGIFWQYPAQNDRRGNIVIVGYVGKDGKPVGDVPNKPLPHWVMK